MFIKYEHFKQAESLLSLQSSQGDITLSQTYCYYYSQIMKGKVGCYKRGSSANLD